MKEKSIKLSDYFKLVKPTYVYLQITPHKSIRNYNSSNISKAIAHTYRAINKRIYKQQKKIFFETNYKISYVIDIKDNNAKFYFIIPDVFKNIIIEKCKEIWSKATMEIVDKIDEMQEDTDLYSLSYKKEDALSLLVDKKSNEPLNSILSVMDIMKDRDRVRIVYNFLPISQFGWMDRYNTTIEKIKEHKSIEKKQMSFDYIARSIVVNIFNIFDSIVQVINDFTGGAPEGSKQSLYAAILGILEQQQSLSSNTNKKKEATILNTQIAVLSQSKDITRKENNALSVCQAYRTLDEDNELIYKKEKHKINIEDYDYKVDTNTMSTDECSNFIQIPGRLLLLQHGIKHINVEENQVPEELKKGYFNLGECTYKGSKVKTYLEDDYNKGNLPLVLIGQQGSGKSEYIKNASKNCIDNNEGVIVLDFIKACNLSEDIARITPKNKLVKLNLSDEKDIQGIGYNEMKIEKNMSAFKKLSLASMQTQQIMNLVDSISIGDPLSSRMRRYLSSASKVVFVQGYNSLKDVVNCLERHEYRSKFINNLTIDLKQHLEDEITTLKELDEWSKGSKKENIEPEIVGTNATKIEHILDRIAMLREDFKLKYMYDKSCNNNINLVECMQKGKVVLIQMKEDDFPTKMTKNILITYWLSKVWLASQIRGGIEEKPLRCNFIVDEIFQAPTSLGMLSYIVPQSRKFGLHPILSTQYIKQLETVFESLEASGSSFMLLRGCNENDFNHFKSKFDGIFDYEDLRDMQQYHSMNLINYSKGYSSFITKLPKPI